MPAAAVMAAATIASGAMAANASRKAADAQAGAAEDSNALQKYIFDTQVGLQAPFREFGLSGTNRLAYMLGLSPVGYGSGGSLPGGTGGTAVGNGLPTLETAEQIRARLAPQFTTTSTPATPAAPPIISGNTGGDGTGSANVPAVAGPTTTVDEAQLQAAIKAEQDKQKAAYDAALGAATTKAEADPQYGSLLDTFGMDDFKADPGYQFRMREGMKALARNAAARGGLFSGRAGKDFLRYGQGMASDEYGKAYDRFRLNQGDQFNRLASVAGIGQTATQQTSAAAGQYGQTVGNNMIGAGNARAAGQVGTANAITGAVGQGVSMYQNNQLINALRGPSPYEPYASNGGGSGNYNWGGGY